MSKKPVKAYQNLDFLKSADARLIRILAEYLEPARRFRKQKVKDTIVFFGSSRTTSREEAEKCYREMQEKYDSAPTAENAGELKLCEKALEMSRYYEDARTLSRLLTEWSLSLKNRHKRFLIVSGGGPGIMEAANRGASEVEGGQSIGLNISIPTEQGFNPYITEELNFEFHYFFMRKFWFIYLAKALVIFPGGFGTMDELWEVLTLTQTKKVTKNMPIVIYGTEYWNKVLNFQAMVENLVIDAKDLNRIHFSDHPREAFEYLQMMLSKQFL
ncbi:MAG: LOG family protein [Calditrichia bacterium]